VSYYDSIKKRRVVMDYTQRPAGAYYTSKANREWYKERNKAITPSSVKRPRAVFITLFASV